MTETQYTIMNTILSNITVPIIIAFGSALLYIITHWFNKFSKSFVARNELAEMEKKNNVRKQLMQSIDEQVEAAVLANMSLADSMKQNGMTITEDQKLELNNSAINMVMNSLPPSLTQPDGVLMEIIGGPDRLDSIIRTSMERHVYDLKMKKTQISTPTEVRIEQPNQQVTITTEGQA